MTITLNNKQHQLVYNFRALRLLGVRGAADTEGLAKVITGSAESWDGMVRLLAAGLGRKVEGEHADLQEYVDDLDFASMAKLIEGIAESLGVKASVDQAQAVEGEQSAPPLSSSPGTSAEQ